MSRVSKVTKENVFKMVKNPSLKLTKCIPEIEIELPISSQTL